MNPRNRVFLVLGLLMVGSLIWYLLTVRQSGDLQLIGIIGDKGHGTPSATTVVRWRRQRLSNLENLKTPLS